MGKIQKVYTKEFKEEAVRLAQTSGKSIVQVARELGISDTSIHRILQGTGTARQRSVSRQRTPNAMRGGKPP
jgi:transposase-like protein